MRPMPEVDENGVPCCAAEECPAYDGKRCELTGFRPGPICEPAVIRLAQDYRRALNVCAAANRLVAAATCTDVTMRSDSEVNARIRELATHIKRLSGESEPPRG